MLITVGICKLPGGRFRLKAQRPQHPAEAVKDYPSEQEARSVLEKLGFSKDTIDDSFRLLRDVDENVNLNFPPAPIPHYLLAEEGLGIEVLRKTPQ
jgi:hypothetical protein